MKWIIKYIHKYPSQSYLLFLFSSWMGLNTLVGIYFIRELNLIFYFQYIVFVFINLGVANEITQMFLCLIFAEQKLAKLELLKNYPKIALLYVTCDDLNEISLTSIASQNYPDLDVFILDDSKKKNIRPYWISTLIASYAVKIMLGIKPEI